MTKHCITCKEKGKKKCASFGNIGEKPMYCSTHKQENMVCLSRALCKCEEEPKQAYFNYSDKTKPEYCETCKLDGMINIVSKKCLDCNKHKPSFNVEGEKKALYCGECVVKNNRQNMVNVNNKKCVHTFDDGKRCGNNPLFNLPGKKGGVYCASHAPDGYVDMYHSKCIYTENDIQCTNSPSFNYKGEKELLYCASHALDGMIDVKHPLCKLCNLNYINASCIDGMCLSCYSFMNPDDPKVTNFLVKEKFLVNYLKTTWPEYTWKYNKFLNTCAKYRPDLLLDMGTHVVIIEIDEHQHNAQNYKDCDLKRSLDILAELARPLIMLRINPDKYMSKDGKKHKPLFKNVKKKLVLDEKVWDERRVEIDARFKECIAKPTEFFTQVNLFFDNFKNN